MNRLRALELYSGIGGFHFALKGLAVDVVAAIDINPHANQTYSHNFPHIKLLQRNIESLKAEEVDKLNVDVIWMSPPCQPFTRLGKQLGHDDRRTESFIQFIQQISRLKRLPSYILMENVKGFECSTSRQKLLNILQENYNYQEFLLTPSEVGIPNSRLRYFLIAKLKPLTFPFQTTGNVLTSFPGSIESDDYKLKQLNFYLESDPIEMEAFILPDKVLLKFINLLDVVEKTSTHSCCFTKGYTHMMEGAGSVLKLNQTVNTTEICQLAKESTCEEDKLKLLRSLNLRYFTSREVANIMGFPPNFGI
ncbi:tRNA (cytosine-5-)-methyltransferase [Chamberlinius hualienensis]